MPKVDILGNNSQPFVAWYFGNCIKWDVGKTYLHKEILSIYNNKCYYQEKDTIIPRIAGFN